MNNKIKIHFILEDEIFSMNHVFHAPRVGDEIRFSDRGFFLIEKLVWIYDEPDCPMQRLNVGISEIDLNQE